MVKIYNMGGKGDDPCGREDSPSDDLEGIEQPIDVEFYREPGRGFS